jgi:SAM-dependent methyltransferase
MSTQQNIQEEQYAYPYHYIPRLSKEGHYSQNQYWSWGFRYLGGIKVVLDYLDKIKFRSLLDLGCGDGRFLREFNDANDGIITLGIDYSKRPISLAKSLNPDINFEVRNIIDNPLEEKFDVITLIEVLEHIPLEQFNSFLDRAFAVLNDGGHCIITVPHTNKIVSDKHFQHFNSVTLSEKLSAYGEIISICPFDSNPRWLSWIFRLLGGTGRYYLITAPSLWDLFYKTYNKKALYVKEESKCLRIMCVVRKNISV